MGKNKFPVGDNSVEFCTFYLKRDFLCRKCTFPPCAPDVDTSGVYYQNPGISIGKFSAECVKTQFVIGCYQYRTALCGFTCAVEARGDFRVVSAKTGPGTKAAEKVTE